MVGDDSSATYTVGRNGGSKAADAPRAARIVLVGISLPAVITAAIASEFHRVREATHRRHR
jgi:hypothetical protein